MKGPRFLFGASQGRSGGTMGDEQWKRSSTCRRPLSTYGSEQPNYLDNSFDACLTGIAKLFSPEASLVGLGTGP